MNKLAPRREEGRDPLAEKKWPSLQRCVAPWQTLAQGTFATSDGLAVAASISPGAWFEIAGRGLAAVAGQCLAGGTFEQTNCFGITRIPHGDADLQYRVECQSGTTMKGERRLDWPSLTPDPFAPRGPPRSSARTPARRPYARRVPMRSDWASVNADEFQRIP